MSDLRFTIGDVVASGDVLTDVQNASDSMTPEECIAFRIACEEVQKAAKLAIDLLNMQFIKTAELDVVMDGRRFYVGRKKDQERFDHSAIAGTVVRYAADNKDPVKAASEAVHLMSQIYISDSTKAKVTQLAALGLPCSRHDPNSVRTWKPGDPYVVDIPAGGAVE